MWYDRRRVYSIKVYVSVKGIKQVYQDEEAHKLLSCITPINKCVLQICVSKRLV